MKEQCSFVCRIEIVMAPRERFELPRIAPAVFETAAIPGLAISAWVSRHDYSIKYLRLSPVND